VENAPEPAHLLLVEDSELVADALRILFESEDRRVSVAASLAEAVTITQTDPAKLVLLDLSLPDGNGLSAVPTLLAAGCKTVVALTGRDDPETHANCLAAGCAAVLIKPVPARELLLKTREWLDA
jgi:DNA-binding response OmpR family regulator